MAEKVILTDKYKKPYMPITRGELVLDSSGNPAFTSGEFLATTKHHGLLSATDKKKIDDITNTSYTLSGGLIENNYQVVLKSNDVNTSQATISSMVGASIVKDENNNETIKIGSAGLVPAPTDINTFLKGDGTWSTITNSLTANKLSETQVFSFTATKSNYCKVVSINITARYTGSSGLLRFYTKRSNQGTNKADSFDVYLHAYQQNALGNKPVLTFKSSNTGDDYDVTGILNTSSTSTTFDLYVYGKGYTYHDLYVSLVQGNLTIQPETCDSLPTGTLIEPTPMGNSELLNGYKQGFTNGTIPIYIPFPGWSQLISDKFLIEDYTNKNHPTEEFLKAICKWAINEYPNKDGITLIGNVSPNSSGTCILHLYSSSGKDPDTGLPRYCRGQYLDLGGNLLHFGTNDYVWSYGRFAQATELTTSSRSKNVTTKGWYRIATSKSSIIRCLGTFEIEGSVSGCHTVTTVLSGINYSENPFITVLNTSHFVNAAITKVRIVYHTTYTNNYAYLEVYKDTTTSTSLTIKLADGYGWSLCDITTGSVPTNYTYKEMPLDNATLSTTGRIITNGIKSTTGEFTGNVYSSAIYNGSKIYATKQEIIHADSNYFELNKGYPDSIMWFNASEYKFKIGSNVLFMIASNGNVGIGNVGGAPAYKLHVGDGEVMANTYHAWSGGFKKNGSSDSYVLLGGGGHKAISDFLTSLPSHSHSDYVEKYISVNTKDMNTIKDPGIYYGYNMSNAGVTDISNFIILNYSNDWGTQLQFSAGSDRAFCRFWQNAGGVMQSTWKEFSFAGHTHAYLPLSGGTMTSTANISWADRGAWNDSSATYPYSYGGLSWSGTSDWIKIYARETGRDALNLVFDFGDDADHYITFRDNGTEYTMIHSGNISSQSVNYATSSSYSRNLLGRTTAGTDYNAVAGNLIFAEWNTHSDNRWYLKAEGYETRVAYATSAGNADKLDNIDSTDFLRKVSVSNNSENDFNSFSNMTLTGRGDPTTGASLKNAPWTGAGPAGGYGVLTYLWSGYGTLMVWGYNSNRIYIRPKYYANSTTTWSSTWDSLALTSDLKNPTDYYWANVKVSSSSNVLTTPTFGKVTISDGTNSILSLKTKTAGAYASLAAYDTGGQYGADVVLQSGSALVLGAGESAASMYSNNVDSLQGSENLYLTADGAVKIFTNCDSIANRKATAFFNTDGSVNIYGHLYTDQPSTNRRAGIIGSYDPNRAAAIWSMGSSYQIAADGTTFGNLYGAAYAYYGAGYTFDAGKSGGHSFVWCQAGTPYVALGNNIWTSGYIETGSYLTFGSYGARFTSDIRSSWRTSIYGNTTNHSRIRPVRTDISIDNFSEIYGSGLTWATADTQGYLSVSYSSGQAWIGGGSGNALNWSTYLVTGKNIGSQSVNYANSAGSAKTHSGYSRTITVDGSSDTYYPVVINTTYSKNLPNIVTIWKNLGSTTASYSGNHSNGTSSCLYRYDVRISLWDGNGGYCKCLNAWYGYAPLVAHTEFTYTSVGQLCIWLRGGGTTYEISSTWDASATVYYSRTDLHGGDYPCIVEPRTSIGNGGIYSTTYLGYGNIYGNATTATTASKVTCTEASGDTPRPIVGVVNNSLYYTSKVTIRWDNGNVTAPTFTGRLIGSADQVNGYTIWTGTQTLYNSATKNNNTIYLIY